MALKDLLGSDHEEELQAYLAENPDILTAAFGLPLIWSGRGPDTAGNSAILLPKLPLGGEYVSDFCLAVSRSIQLDFVLIELERAIDRPYQRNGNATSRLNTAVRQVLDWLGWLEDSTNLEFFRKAILRQLRCETRYGQLVLGMTGALPLSLLEVRPFLTGKIVIGTRSMLTRRDNSRRTALMRQTSRSIEVVPYDRLVETEAALQRSGMEALEQKHREAFDRETNQAPRDEAPEQGTLLEAEED